MSSATVTTTSAAAKDADASSSKKQAPQGPLDYVLMALPAKNPEELENVWSKHVDIVQKEKIGLCAHFDIPDLPVGTFDTLMTLSDELGRVDTFAEGLCRKIVTTLTELYSASSCLFSVHFTYVYVLFITILLACSSSPLFLCLLEQLQVLLQRAFPLGM